MTPIWENTGQSRTNPLWSPQILFHNTHTQPLFLPTVGMCTSDFAALCWVMPRPLPKIAALLLITPPCPLAIGWSFGRPAKRHGDETASQLCLRSNAILIFFAGWKARGHCDITATGLRAERVCVTQCVWDLRVWGTCSEWLGAVVTLDQDYF